MRIENWKVEFAKDLAITIRSYLSDANDLPANLQKGAIEIIRYKCERSAFFNLTLKILLR
jgi:hypothetical protein